MIKKAKQYKNSTFDRENVKLVFPEQMHSKSATIVTSFALTRFYTKVGRNNVFSIKNLEYSQNVP